MPRYFIEVSYLGTLFSGFQIQQNAITIQGEINKALQTLLNGDVPTTTASRTDAGVHAFQNFLHFDYDEIISDKIVYKMNAILHQHIVVHAIYQVNWDNHSRFDAISREYEYCIIQRKNPFLKETSYFYPSKLDIDKLNAASQLIQSTINFSSFAKRHTDVTNYNCTIESAVWEINNKGQIVFHVTSNRFLRGMVRALVGTQLLVGANRITLHDFEKTIHANDCTKADFSAPAQGLFLSKVNYPTNILSNPIAKIRSEIIAANS